MGFVFFLIPFGKELCKVLPPSWAKPVSNNKHDQLLERFRSPKKSGVAHERQSLWPLGHCHGLPGAHSDEEEGTGPARAAAKEPRRTPLRRSDPWHLLQEASARQTDTYKLLHSARGRRPHGGRGEITPGCPTSPCGPGTPQPFHSRGFYVGH